MAGAPEHLSRENSACLLGPTAPQLILAIASFSLLVGLAILSPSATGLFVMRSTQSCFLTYSVWRIVLIHYSHPRALPFSVPIEWPVYSILVALHDEAEVLPRLIERLTLIDYPLDRLEGFLLLEAHDIATIEAASLATKPDWLEIRVVPPGSPRTKPRALNYGLQYAKGEYVTIYDAEDEPDPLQLREAAGRFADDADQRFGCLQAPLRIRRLFESKRPSPFLDRQFMLEYAALFEVTLPGMARLGLPFPLGGTSNHFRTRALREVGAWDPFNVTEDADLGFRLHRQGWDLGVLRLPTYETPPGTLQTWLPQRTRWLKGYMQTWGVHTRRSQGLGLRGWVAMISTVGVGLSSAAICALVFAWIAANASLRLAEGLAQDIPIFATTVLVVGIVAAWIQAATGAKRAGIDYRIRDMVRSPLYWSLLTLAFFHALWRLIVEPHKWDKTTHHLDEPAGTAACLVEPIRGNTGRQAA